ncbi:hypothetical protein JCM11491_006668 [Sporobolomyces phaffii]
MPGSIVVTSEQIQHARTTRRSRAVAIAVLLAVTVLTLVAVLAPLKYFDDPDLPTAAVATAPGYECAARVGRPEQEPSCAAVAAAAEPLVSDPGTTTMTTTATMATTTTPWSETVGWVVDRVGDVVLGLFGFDQQDWFDFSEAGLTPDEEDQFREFGVESGGSGTGLASWTESSLYVERTQSLHPSRPSAFGPHLLEKPLRGFLYPISIHTASPYGCSPPSAASALVPSQHDGEWIALVQRGECPFSTKVRIAQELGAAAVVFGDEDEERGGIKGGKGLLTPWSPDDTKDVRIPSIFVSRASYLSLIRTWQDEQRLVLDGPRSPEDDNEGDAHVVVAARRHVGLEVVLSKDEVFTWPLLDLLFLLLFLPSLLTLLTVFTQRVRMARAQKAERAPRSAVAKLVVFKWGEPTAPEKTVAAPPGGGETLVGSQDEEREIGLRAPLEPEEEEEARGGRQREEPTESTSLLQPSAQLTTTTTTIPSSASPSLLERLGAFLPRRFRRRRSSCRSTLSSSLSSSSSASLPLRGPNPRYPSLTECSICLDAFVVNESVVIELPCSHLFHRDCAMDWLLQRKGVCPICRKSVMDEPASASASASAPQGE